MNRLDFDPDDTGTRTQPRHFLGPKGTACGAVSPISVCTVWDSKTRPITCPICVWERPLPGARP